MPQQQRKKYCPGCGAEIEHLNYEASADEWGIFDLRTEDTEANDSNINETTYKCPECGMILDPWDDNFDSAPDDERTNKPVPAAEPNNMIIHNFYHQGIKFFICPKCKEHIEIENMDEEIICPECGKKVNANNAKVENR